MNYRQAYVRNQRYQAVGDVLVSTACIAEFTYGSYLFQKWWILLFALLPLLMYYSSGIVVIGEPVEEGVRTIPDEDVLKQIEAMEAAQAPVKRKPGRPKGSKNKPGSKPHVFKEEYGQLVDPKTGITVNNRAAQSQVIARMGDERVTAFVQYHMDMLKMRQGVDKKNVPDLYNRFFATSAIARSMESSPTT